MKRLEYKTPEIEVINIEIEGSIMAFSTTPDNTGSISNILSKSSAIKSSYSMDDYNWK